MYGEGVSKAGELIDLGVKAGVVEKSGLALVFFRTVYGWARAGELQSRSSKANQVEMADKIEHAIRENAGLIADRILEEGQAEENDAEEA